MGRVTKTGGHILLHFESSSSFEHIGRRRWNKSIALVETINAGKTEKIWTYSPHFVIAIMEAYGFIARASGAFHIASSMVNRLGWRQPVAAVAARFDRYVQALRYLADDQIILAEKIS
jgi:hypothetical protein